MTPLQQIPAKVRAWLYWAGYIVGVLGQGTTIIWGAIAAASPEVAMPLELVIASAVLGLLQTQLNLLSGSNVTSDAVVDENTLSGRLQRIERVLSRAEARQDAAARSASARRGERGAAGARTITSAMVVITAIGVIVLFMPALH